MSDEEEILALEREAMDQGDRESTGQGFADAFNSLKSSKFYDEKKLMPTSEEVAASTSKLVTSKNLISGGAVMVSSRQRGNPLLQHIRRVPWQYEETLTADYVPGASTGILFLSLRYHSLNPDYIHDRLRMLGQMYQLRVLLVQCDSPDPHHSLKSLTRICLLADITLMLAWSAEEAARLIETYKIFENKPADLIMEKTDSDPHSKLVSALSSIRSVNQTDAVTLLTTFGTLEKIINASLEELELCPGLGPQKAAKLYSVLHQPFLKPSTRKSASKPGPSTSKS